MYEGIVILLVIMLFALVALLVYVSGKLEDAKRENEICNYDEMDYTKDLIVDMSRLDLVLFHKVLQRKNINLNKEMELLGYNDKPTLTQKIQKDMEKEYDQKQ